MAVPEMGVAGLRYNWKCGEFIASAAGRPYPGPPGPCGDARPLLPAAAARLGAGEGEGLGLACGTLP